MKKKIDWHEIGSGENFQDLCNMILTYEVSKDVVPFGAKGRDKSTDAQYSGTYNKKTGEWRFQHKFHDPTMDKTRARNLFKNEFKKELQDISKEKPDFFVFMTNVKVTKTYFDKMMALASKYNFDGFVKTPQACKGRLKGHFSFYL